MQRRSIGWVCATAAILAGCTASVGAGGNGSGDGKRALFGGGKFDSSLEGRICADAGLPEGCDVCEANGYYGDGECDTFCSNPDSDCGGACADDGDCPQIYCITTPCPQYTCRSGQCVQQTGCEAMDAYSPDDQRLCGAFFGVAWNGAACVGLTGCSCVGADCNALFGTVEECEAARSSCIQGSPCAPQQAAGTGLCEAIVGVFWDGQDCVAASGCRCEGADCGNGYVDIASCEAEHAACGNQQDDCVVGGCSGQLCYDPAIDGGITTCEWREEYACYAQATCKRQPSGQCGWTQTLELQMCLSSSSCPTLSPPSPNFCGQNGPNPIPNYDENGCVTGYECPSTTDCRSSGCGRGSNCSWCWGSYACLPDGAVC